MMDPFILNALFVLGGVSLLAPIGFWLLPKMDRVADRIEAWFGARRTR